MRVLFQWGLFLALIKFFFDFFLYKKKHNWSFIQSFVEAIAFGLLFSVVFAYLTWKKNNKGNK